MLAVVCFVGQAPADCRHTCTLGEAPAVQTPTATRRQAPGWRMPITPRRLRGPRFPSPPPACPSHALHPNASPHATPPTQWAFLLWSLWGWGPCGALPPLSWDQIMCILKVLLPRCPPWVWGFLAVYLRLLIRFFFAAVVG